MAGMMAMSTSPRRSASAHCEGTVNESSYLPVSGPSVKPQTSGAVFRYSTIEMRSLLKGFLAASENSIIARQQDGVGRSRVGRDRLLTRDELFGGISRICLWRCRLADDRQLWERICQGDVRAF